VRQAHPIPQDQIHESWLKLPVLAFGGFLDGASQLLGRHRAYVFLLFGHRLTQFRILCKMGIKVGAQRENEGNLTSIWSNRSKQVVNECLTLELIAAEGKQLFELIENQKCMVIRVFSGEEESQAARVLYQIIH
jgi:hypothetical protein